MKTKKEIATALERLLDACTDYGVLGSFDPSDEKVVIQEYVDACKGVAEAVGIKVAFNKRCDSLATFLDA